MKKLLILLMMLLPINVCAFDSNAKGTILMDMDSGRVIYAKNAHYAKQELILYSLQVFQIQN